MIEGIKHSKAHKVIFKHNDLADLEAKLSQYPKETPKIIAFESVYSMCGSVAPIAEICDLAEKYGALTFLDEVRLFPRSLFLTSISLHSPFAYSYLFSSAYPCFP